MHRSLRSWGWLLWLALLPWAPFLLTRKLDLWHAQTAWLHGGLLILGLVGMGRGLTSLPNRPLAWWLGWSAVWSLWLWHQGILRQQVYPLNLLMSAGHLATLGLLWVVVTSQLSVDGLPWLWRGLALSAVGLVLYGVCQLWNLDQFFNNLDTNDKRDTLVGLLGNPNHFGAWLALCVPLFLSQPERWWKGLALAALLLIATTHSLGAGVAVVAGLLWWVAAQRPKWLYAVIPASLLLAWIILTSDHSALKDHGRWTVWPIYWKLWLQQPITGVGPGAVMEMSRGLPVGHPLFTWRHCHNEYLQLLVEQGLLGFGLASWLLLETLKRAWAVRKMHLGAACGAMLVAVLANSLVNFPLHLATIATWSVLAMATVWMLSETRTAKC